MSRKKLNTKQLTLTTMFEGWIVEPIHEQFKPLKTQEKILMSFTPNKLKP